MAQNKKSKFKIGDRVQVKSEKHDKKHTGGKIGKVVFEPVYAIYFDNDPETLHKWYVESELIAESKEMIVSSLLRRIINKNKWKMPKK